MPTDFLPRVIPLEHWETIAAGVSQRIRAINHFLVQLYSGGQDVVPDEAIYTSQYFYPEVQGFRPPKDVFVHIYGIDLVHLGEGRYVVLEDNLRIPSGISYQLKSVGMGAVMFPEFAEGYDILSYDIRDAYWGMFRSIADSSDPVCVLLTDGKYGSAFFEHRYLSELLGIPLVEGPDLYVGPDGLVYVRTLDLDVPVDVVYRRVEDLDLFGPRPAGSLPGRAGGAGQRHRDRGRGRQAGVPLGAGNDRALPGRGAGAGTGPQLQFGRARRAAATR